MGKSKIIYDGMCNFCQGWINWLLKVADPRDFELISCNYINSIELSHEITEEACNKYIHVITPENKMYWGADAVREIWLKVDHWSRPVAYLLKLPGIIQLARIGYDLVSRNRHKLPGISG
ncbi:DUF393 domain-containing protein [bacterium AH-315-C07]|nr:DUF393 domain-containing protein [bacterium AH-315-C07]